MMKSVTFGLLPLVLLGCGSGPFPAPASAMIGDFEDYSITGTSAHLAQDGLGTLLFGDIIVQDSDTEVPLNNIEVEILTGWSGLYVIPDTAIKLVDQPDAPPGVLDGTEAVEDYCDKNTDGLIDEDADDWCSWWWDTESGQFFEFSGDYAMSTDNYQPTYMIGATDNRGLLRFYMFVDSLPYEAEGESWTFAGTSFWVSIGVDSVTAKIEVE